MAGSEAAKEAISISALACELGLHNDSPIAMGMDNRSAIDVAHNPEHFGRMKHVARRHFFVRECVENHLICVPFVRTDDGTDANDADFFTKVMPARKFFPLRNKIMNVPAHLRWDAASSGSASRMLNHGTRGALRSADLASSGARVPALCGGWSGSLV